MQALNPGQPPEPSPDGSGDAIVETLARWDELTPEDLASLERDPRAARDLERLRQADAWLRELRVAPTPCPEADELYDFGRGPGYRPMAADRRSAIAEHVELCADCREAVQVLETSPPLPLHWSEDGEAPGPAGPFGDRSEESERPLPRRAPVWRRLGPVAAAAAAVLLAVQLGQQEFGRQPGAGVPGVGAPQAVVQLGETSAPAIGESVSLETPLFRGDLHPTLLFPRGRVLADGGDHALLADGPLFELEPQAGADRYRVVLRRHDGSAFATADAATEVLEVEGARALLAAELALEPGHYTWEAWATIDGLDTPLGGLDFEVVEDAPLSARLATLETEAAARALLEAGFRSDARHLARDLPATAEMRALLDERPNR